MRDPRFLALALALACTGCGLRLPSTVIVEEPELRVVRLSVASANVFVVEQNGRRLMIDAGNPGDAGEYERLMREHDIEPATLDALLLTHGHIDHAGTAAHFQQTYGIPVIGGAGDQPMIDASGAASTVCPTSFLARVIGWSLAGDRYEAFTLDEPLAGDLDLAALGMEGRVLLVPGHTPGSLVALIGEHAFVGDLIRGGLLDPGEPRLHFFMCDREANRADIAELLTREGIEQWHPAHFGPFPADAVREWLGD